MSAQSCLHVVFWAKFKSNRLLFFNLVVNKKPLDDVRVRQALNYAVDKQAINDALYEGLATTANGVIGPFAWGQIGLDDFYEYDPQKAKDLLQDLRRNINEE